MFYRISRSGLSFLAIAALSSLTGCASIVSGTSQVVSVETLHSSGNVAGATCKLQNDKGVYYVTTPGTVTVHRAYGDMNVKCEKPGFESGLANVKSSTKGMMAGNILFGGVIGAGVDAASGAAYDYPALFQVMMGQQQTIQSPVPQTSAQSQPQVAAAGTQ
jgi:hypothetical protein